MQCCLNEGVGPAMYIAPEPDLAARVREEAENLGIAVVDDDPESPSFLGCRAICVTTMQRVINGRSRYGLDGPGGRQPVLVKALVVPKSHDAYAKVLDLFDDDLMTQVFGARDTLVGATTAPTSSGDRSAADRPDRRRRRSAAHGVGRPCRDGRSRRRGA